MEERLTDGPEEHVRHLETRIALVGDRDADRGIVRTHHRLLIGHPVEPPVHVLDDLQGLRDAQAAALLEQARYRLARLQRGEDGPDGVPSELSALPLRSQSSEGEDEVACDACSNQRMPSRLLVMFRRLPMFSTNFRACRST